MGRARVSFGSIFLAALLLLVLWCAPAAHATEIEDPAPFDSEVLPLKQGLTVEDGNTYYYEDDVAFTGGCPGNLKAIPALVDGWTAEEIASKLSGIRCGIKTTSCGDQLAKAVLAAKEAELAAKAE